MSVANTLVSRNIPEAWSLALALAVARGDARFGRYALRHAPPAELPAVVAAAPAWQPSERLGPLRAALARADDGQDLAALPQMVESCIVQEAERAVASSRERPENGAYRLALWLALPRPPADLECVVVVALSFSFFSFFFLAG